MWGNKSGPEKTPREWMFGVFGLECGKVSLLCTDDTAHIMFSFQLARIFSNTCEDLGVLCG